MWTLSSAQIGTGCAISRNNRVRACGQRLFDQRDAEFRRRCQVFADVCFRPSFIGVQDDAGCSARPATTARMRSMSPSPPILTLSSGRVALARACAAIVSGSPSDKRESRFNRHEAGVRTRFRDAASGNLGLKVPQRAIHRVARGTWRHNTEQGVAAYSVGDIGPRSLDRIADAFHRFAIAAIGNAFATSSTTAVVYRAGQHLGLGLRATRNCEDSGDRETLGLDGNVTRHIFLPGISAVEHPQSDRAGTKG